jgi:methyl-accepting chemotaxis protein
MTSVAQVQSGVGLVANVENRLGHISDQVEELGTLVISISESSQRQAASVDQINRAMQGLEQTTQHNTAMAEEATAACVSMARNASSAAQRGGEMTSARRTRAFVRLCSRPPDRP